MRKFYLQNASGERFALNGERGVYFTEPEGLGVMLSPSFGALGSGFFASVDETARPQNAVAGTLRFRRGAAYEIYRELIDWIYAAGELIFVYDPSGEEYYRKVKINYINKGEKGAHGWLECPASLLPLTPWYRPSPTELSIGEGDSGGSGESMTYDYLYGDDLVYGAGSAANMSARIQGTGHSPAGFVLRYVGAIQDPVIRLVGNASGKTYGVCALESTLSASDVLELSTRQEDSHVVKIAADGTVTDLINDVDPSADYYPRIPVDEACTISVESSASFSGTASVLVYYYFDSR